jgi:hypothetical protein
MPALWIEPLKIGTKRIGRKVLLPPARREAMHVEGGMGINTLEYIHEIET